MADANLLQSILERVAAVARLTRREVRAGKTLQSVFERAQAAVMLRPAIGQGSETTTIRLCNGTTCEVEDGPWQTTADADPQLGGSDDHPDPSFFLRAAIGTCFAQTAALWAAKFDVPLARLVVDVEADHDARGLLGVGERASRFTGLRCGITVESPAPEEEVQRVLDAAHEHSPVRGSLEHAFAIERDEQIVPSAG